MKKYALLCFCFFLFAVSLVYCKQRKKTAPHVISNIPSHTIRCKKKLKKFDLPLEMLRVTANDDVAIHKAFLRIKEAASLLPKSYTAAKSDEHKAKNRYNFLPAQDLTRTCRELDGFYINANDVDTPSQKYIVTQGPLKKTVADFWKMILHKDVQLIVNLTMDVEFDKKKCTAYWTQKRLPCRVEEHVIEIESEKVLYTHFRRPQRRLVLRTFTATHSSSEKKRRIKQLHYENWEDNKEPDLWLFSKLLDAADQENDKNTPIVVHCSAGIGRSGTFVAAHSIRKKIRSRRAASKKNVTFTVNIPHFVYLLRCQRPHLVGTVKQMQAVYKTISLEHPIRQKPFFVLSRSL